MSGPSPEASPEASFAPFTDETTSDYLPSHDQCNHTNQDSEPPSDLIPDPAPDPDPLVTPAAHSPPFSLELAPDGGPLQGFDTLDPVQRYALGALAVVLLEQHATDLNGAAFARTQSVTILDALRLPQGQHEALLVLDPSAETRHTVVTDCVRLVGGPDDRWRALQAMLVLSVIPGVYDARSRSFLALVARHFGISWRAVAAVELAVAIALCNPSASAEASTATTATSNDTDPTANSTADVSEPTDTPRPLGEVLTERRKKKMRTRKAIKISGITLVGGMLFGLTGGLIAPALLTALAGVGVASAAGLAASGTLASSAVVGGLFGVAGGGFSLKKARHRVSTNLTEFDFERPDDPRVIEQRERKVERERRKLERLVAKRLEEQAKANECPAIQDSESNSRPHSDSPYNQEAELPRPTARSDDEDEDEDDDDDDTASSRSSNGKSTSRFGKRRRKKKREKVKVGSRGLEATASVPGLHMCICVPAWLTDKGYGAALDQFEMALKQELPCSQHIALRWESRRLYEMGLAFAKFWASKATVTTVQQAYPHAIAAASTVAGAVAFAFAIPLTVMSCMDYIDNPWSILVSRSNGAGEELANVLVERSYGNRPVTLFGYSLGARVIFKCLEALADRGAHGIVDNVFVMGAAITADPERWQKIRSTVAGRIVNAYGSYDWALAFFHRGCGHGVYVSGLRRVEVEGVENLNMAYLGMEGHRELKDCVPRVMRAMGVGLGYITMPPAKLLLRRKRGGLSDCEGEGERVVTVDESALVGVEPEQGLDDGRNGSLSAMRFDSFWDSRSPKDDFAESRLDTSGDLKIIPPSVASETESGKTSEAESIGEGSDSSKSRAVRSKRSGKSKSWLSWGGWGGGSSKSKQKSLNGKRTKTDTTDSGVDTGLEDGVESIRMEDMNEAQGGSSKVKDREGRAETNMAIGNADASPMKWESGSGAVDNEFHRVEEVVGVAVSEVEEAFDWEKQRKIWDEQERQMQERGYADSALEIEMQNKVVLNISVEVAGRRLERFVDQDSTLPVGKKEELYTNCLEVQRGMHIRLFEHERRTKSVANVSGKEDAAYPKLLGEMEFLLREPAVKGLLRVAVGMHVDDGGDVHAYAEERFADGEIGERVEMSVPRAELCTMSERVRLETAERKRLEAQIQRQMRNRNALPALPGPSSVGGVTGEHGERKEERSGGEGKGR